MILIKPVYGMDTERPSPFENSANNVVTLELNLNLDIKTIRQFLSESFNLLAASTQMGIGISIMVKEHISKLLLGE